MSEKVIKPIDAITINKNPVDKDVAINKNVFGISFSAYAIPIAFLLYVLYMNFLPFGYNKTFTIEVGGPNDVKVSEFYLELSKNLSESKIAPDGTTYRELNGIAYATFKPIATLKKTEITVSVEDDGIFVTPPLNNFDTSITNWDYSWNFMGETIKNLDGSDFSFDGKSKLELPNSNNEFENSPFSIYAEWEPKDNKSNAQQIIGHFNWELWQNKNSVSFQVGRMNNATGTIYSIIYPVDSKFFNKKHSAIAIYNPSENGYIELFIDGNFAGMTHFGTDKIWDGYGNKNLTIGKSNHEIASYFTGILYKINIIKRNILPPEPKISFKMGSNYPINIIIISTATSTLKQIKLNAIQR
jgi:hypothetical protein